MSSASPSAGGHGALRPPSTSGWIGRLSLHDRRLPGCRCFRHWAPLPILPDRSGQEGHGVAGLRIDRLPADRSRIVDVVGEQELTPVPGRDAGVQDGHNSAFPEKGATPAPATRESDHLATSVDAQGLADRVSRKRDRKSTRLNSSHVAISYAVFCLKKKK